MGRLQHVQRAFDERNIDAPPAAVDAISASLGGQLCGLGRTGQKGTDGFLVISTHGAIVWDARDGAIRDIDLGAYSNTRTNGAVISLCGDEVDAIPIFADGRGDAWRALLSFYGITKDSGASVNTIRTHLDGLTPKLAPQTAHRLAMALARELAPGESIEIAIPARRLSSGRRSQGVLVLTADRLIHVEEHPKRSHAEAFDLSQVVGISSGVQPLPSSAIVTLAHADVIHQYVVGSGPRGREQAERLASAAADRIPVENRDRARWWERSTLPRVSVSVLEYYGGHPLFPKGAGTLVLKLSNAGFVAESTFGTLFFVPWSVVTGFSVEAADTLPRRIPTPTRMLAVGVASFVLKNSAYEQSHLVLETDDGEMVFAISQTPQKLRSRLAPYVGAFGAAPQRAIGVTYRVGNVGQRVASTSQDDPLEAIRRLAELRDAGALTAAEFSRKKAELLKRI